MRGAYAKSRLMMPAGGRAKQGSGPALLSRYPIPKASQFSKGVLAMKNFQVFGGQYESHYYGESDSLRGARLIASRNREYWDNWQGWHTPRIYLSADVREVESRGRITTPDGIIIRVPVSSVPFSVRDEKTGRWMVWTI